MWLYKRGEHEKAQRSRRRLFGNVAGFDWDHEYAVFGAEVDSSIKLAAQSSRFGMLACLKGTNLRRTLVSAIPLCLQVSCQTND